MAVSVGELFVNMGIKGSEKTVNAIVSIQDGMKNAASMSIEAKAAILGVLYGIERLTDASVTMSTTILNLSSLTGEGMKEFQQWGKAAEQAGVSANDAYSQIINVQKKITDWQRGRTPEGWSLLAQSTPGGFDKEKINGPGGIAYWMDFLRRAAKGSTLPEGLRNQLIENMGGMQSLIGPMSTGMFDDKVLNRMKILTDSQVKANRAFGAGMTQIRQDWEQLFGQMTAAHGTELIQTLKEISTQIKDIVKALDEWGTKNNVIKEFGAAVKDVMGALKLAVYLVGNFLKGIEVAIKGYGMIIDPDTWKQILNGIPDVVNSPGGAVINNFNTNINAPGATKQDADRIGRAVEKAHKNHVNKTQSTLPRSQQK